MNPSKRKGTDFETRVVRFFHALGFDNAERRALNGNVDRGDIAGIRGVMIECKAEQRIDLAGYMEEVRAERRNAGAEIGVAIVKRRNRGVHESYVVMELDQFAEMIGDRRA